MLAPARAFRETSLSDAVAYAAHACVAALSVTLRTTRPRTPTRLRVSGAPDAPGQRDYRSVVDQTSTERRRSALPPLTPFPYHDAWFSRANHEGYHRTLTTCLACRFQPSVRRRLPASPSLLISQQRLASRARNSHAVRASRDPRRTTGPFATSATTVSEQGLHTRRACCCQSCHKTPNATRVTGAQTASMAPLFVRPCSRAGWASL
jgi:hypothetical protein